MIVHLKTKARQVDKMYRSTTDAYKVPCTVNIPCNDWSGTGIDHK